MMGNLRSVQKQFVSDIRNPALYQASSDDERRRMGIYQSLFFNNINSFLKSGFPVLYAICSDEVWHEVVRDFFMQHRCRSPYFAEISKEFVEYLSAEPVTLKMLPPFASELAHYEWLELDVSIRREPVRPSSGAPGALSMSPLASLVSYAYPVHLIGEDYLPDTPSTQRNYYVVYRQADYSVQFLQVNAMTAMLLQIIETSVEPINERALCAELQKTAPHLKPEVLEKGVKDTLQQLSRKGIIQQTPQ